MAVRDGSAQGLGVENRDAKSFLVWKIVGLDPMAMTKLLPLSYVHPYWVAELDPAINVPLEAQKVSTATETDPSYLHSFFRLQNHREPMPFQY